MNPERAVYLLQRRLGPKGKRTKKDHWETLGAYLSRAEADAAGRAHNRRCPHGWRVYGVPAGGALAQRLDAA